MKGFWSHFGISLRLHFRNRLGLIYGYLFPLIFLAAFWVLYRHEKIPLARHMGELLTVAVLGGACFGLPTTLVSERERGVWRRYRLAPVPAWSVAASTVAARYVIILGAGLLQLTLTLATGLPWPSHALGLWVAFTFVSFAFLGLGLLIAMLADTVPAVQALGQCIFLPMLIIGGVAVPLESLPGWVQHLSAFFPGRYAVSALQECVDGGGWPAIGFNLIALALIGAAAGLAGARLFRWDAERSPASPAGKAWVLAALAAWICVGLLAEYGQRIVVSSGVVAPPLPAPAAQAPPWITLTAQDVSWLDYTVPPDSGVVTPIAPADEVPGDEIQLQIDSIRIKLSTWGPAHDRDEVQAVRNCLYVAAVPDVLQLPIESYVPLVVLGDLTGTYPRAKLIKMLAWIAKHPEDGTVMTRLPELGIPGEVGDPDLVRERAYLYAIKFIARLTKRKEN